MKTGEFFAGISAGILIGILALGIIPINSFLGHEQEGPGVTLNISASKAIQILANDSNASAYLSENFKAPQWRVVKTTLVRDTAYDLNGSMVKEGDEVWKVEVLERTCACSGVSTLYVVEGYVSAGTGEVLDVSTKVASEEKYDRATCSSTSCH